MPYDVQTNIVNARNPFSYEKVEQITRDISTAWLSLEEITNQLNLFEDTSQDNYLADLELATRMHIEDYLGMSIFPITYKVYYGNISTVGIQACFDLPEVTQGASGVTINDVSYYNGDTPPVFTAIDLSAYFYDPTGNKVIVDTIPSGVNTIMSNPIVITYSTIANTIAQYPVIKQAGLLLLTHLYNNRSETNTGRLETIPYGVQTLLRLYKPLVM